VAGEVPAHLRAVDNDLHVVRGDGPEVLAVAKPLNLSADRIRGAVSRPDVLAAHEKGSRSVSATSGSTWPLVSRARRCRHDRDTVAIGRLATPHL